MPEYFYTAKSLKGEIKKGNLIAKDHAELARALHSQGYFLISADLTEKKEEKKKFSISFSFLNYVPLSEKMFFTRNLQVMIKAGVSLPRAIRMLASQTRNKAFKKILLDIAQEITKGKSFSASLQKYPNIFSELFQNMVKVGEETGTLEDVLKQLNQQMYREHELRSKIKGALVYPAVIVCAMIGIGFLMLIMVVPRLAETFEELNVELPLTTKIVIALGVFFAEKWLIGIFIIVAGFFLLRMILKTAAGKRIIDKLTLRIPIISPIIRKTNSAYTARNLSALFSSGVPIVRAIEVVARALGNIYFQEALFEAAEKVRKGSKLSEALVAHVGIFPVIIVQMIEVGEETGETSDVLENLALFFEEEAADSTKNLSAVIEPVLMLLIGGAIGFFAVSMIQPMYSMLGAI